MTSSAVPLPTENIINSSVQAWYSEILKVTMDQLTNFSGYMWVQKMNFVFDILNKFILGRWVTFLKWFGLIQLKSAALWQVSLMEVGTVISLLAIIIQPETIKVNKFTHSVQQLRLVPMESMQPSQACVSNRWQYLIIGIDIDKCKMSKLQK